MGCCDSRERNFRERLDGVDFTIQSKAWRVGHTVGEKQFFDTIQELRELNAFFKQKQDKAALQRIQGLASMLAKELVSFVPSPLRDRDSPTVALVRRLAPELDRVCLEPASAMVEQKIEEQRRKLARARLQRADILLQQMREPATVRHCVREVADKLGETQSIASEMSDLIPEFLRHSNTLRGKVLEAMVTTVESEPDSLNTYLGVAKSLDDMCISLAQRSSAVWKPIVPEVEQKRDEIAQVSVPHILDQLESCMATLAPTFGVTEGALGLPSTEQAARSCWCPEPGTSKLEGAAEAEKDLLRFDFRDVVQVVSDMALLCPAEKLQPAGTSARLLPLIQSFEAHVRAEFQRALAAGEGDRLEALVCLVEEIDRSSTVLLPDRMPIAADLKEKKAKITLNQLLSGAEANVKTKCGELHAAFTSSEARVKEVRNREKLKEKSGTATWKFKLAHGAFKDFSPEKSDEVERLYQKWVKKGKPTDILERRYEITLQVEARRKQPAARRSISGSETPVDGMSSASLLPKGSSESSSKLDGKKRRERCKFGRSCYRKNEQHLAEFAHLGDPDWEDQVDALPLPSISSAPTRADSRHTDKATLATICGGSTTSIVDERYSLDFFTMTQFNKSRGIGFMRNINRREPMSLGEKETHAYFSYVVEFVKEVTNMLGQAEAELRLLGEIERKEMQRQVEQLKEAIKPILQEFLGLAAFVESMTAIDDMVALLGVHSEGLGVMGLLKKVRLANVIEELRAAYIDESKPAALKKWAFLRLMCKKQAVAGPLYKCRPSLVQTREEVRTSTQRHVQMRCQALLGEYESDISFAKCFRKEAGEILYWALWRECDCWHFEASGRILARAVAWQCDLTSMLDLARTSIRTALLGAADSKWQPLARMSEVLDAGVAIAKAAQRPFLELCDVSVVVQPIAQKALREVEWRLCSGSGKAHTQLPESVKQVVELRQKLAKFVTGGDDANNPARLFDAEFWKVYKGLYESSAIKSTELQACAVEWAIAFCEQLKQKLPPWMLNKDQVEALKKMREAIDGREESKLREAVIFTRQTDYTCNQQLVDMYDDAINQLKTLKRLPSGWEVHELVGDTATAKMFKKVDIMGGKLKELFQQMFDATNIGIKTRDRLGTMPSGYKVHKIDEVRNAESWSSYLGRADSIEKECKRFPGAAPFEAWENWSGIVATAELGKEILNQARLPPLEGTRNEFLMFHGTKPEAAHSIAENHFDMAFACKTGLFGAGLYLCESSSKSDEYVKPNKDGHYPVIICRVTLGHINYVPNSDPVKDPGREKLESSCLRGDYHSVLGDRKKARGTYREFIVYDNFQVYPHFIVWYSRLGG